MLIIQNKTKDELLEQLDKEYPGVKHRALKEVRAIQLNELEKLADKYRGKQVNGTLYQLAKSASGDKMVFDPELKKLLRNNCTVEIAHFVETNWKSFESGRLFVLNVEKTEKQIAEFEQMKIASKEREQLESEVGEEVANTIKAIGQAAKQKVGRSKK